MRIGEINGSISRQAGAAARGAASETESRALVVVEPSAVHRQMPDTYRHAAFLAHLIAAKDHLPQTRERRRAEPGEAIAAYRAAAAMGRH